METNQANSEDSLRIIRFPELHRIVGLSRSQIWRLERDGAFPRSIQLGKNSKGWIKADVLAWLEERRNWNTSRQAA